MSILGFFVKEEPVAQSLDQAIKKATASKVAVAEAETALKNATASLAEAKKVAEGDGKAVLEAVKAEFGIAA